MKLLEWLKHIAETFATNGFTDELENEIINNINSFEYKIHDWLHDTRGFELSIGFINKSNELDRVFIWFDRNGTPDLEDQIKKVFYKQLKS